jgi:hypothetical protein
MGFCIFETQSFSKSAMAKKLPWILDKIKAFNETVWHTHCRISEKQIIPDKAGKDCCLAAGDS